MDYQITGNEYVSLPAIRETDGGVESISFLYMQLKGMLEMYGKDSLVRPYLRVNGQRCPLCPQWTRSHFWIPSFTAETEDVRFSCTYLSPLGERGFGLRLEAENRADHALTVRFGAEGEWEKTLHTVNESIPLTEGRGAKESGWNSMFIFYQAPGVPLFAFAPITEDHQPFSEIDQGAKWSLRDFAYDIHLEKTLPAGGKAKLDVFFGIGYEQVAAATSAKEMLRQGFDALLTRTERWLAERERHVSDPALETLLNTNLFFAFFYASGRTVDTEELCMMTSRSPRYYVSAAYWDRDSLLWAFPAICETDAAYARELLVSVYQRQSRNFGVHSRFIDGTVLEPGFELDELCAPVLALRRYLDKTNDRTILSEACVRSALLAYPRKLEARRHKDVSLYSTFLQPTDDLRCYPYLTYDNVLVWRTLHILSDLLENEDLSRQAERVKEAIYGSCVYEHDSRRIFAWSVDLNGNWDIYDEPPGSIQLLPFYGFCGVDDEVWRNTVSVIRDPSYAQSFADCPIAEIGCPHAPHPWVLSICNSLLSGHQETAVRHLRMTRMDNGIACESVDEFTGACTTGEAFATCAGFLAYSMLTVLTGKQA